MMYDKYARLLSEELSSLECEIKSWIKNEQTIRVKYFKAVKNWGDILNEYLIEAITGKKVIHHPLGLNKHLLAIGSVLGSANKKSVVWGSGLIREQQSPKEKPKKITAVRGPLTRKRLLSLSINCPEVYGDPCILLSRFYDPRNTVLKKYKIGIIAHYVDKTNPIIQEITKNEDVLLIDIQQDIEPFIDQLCSCEMIASSSLHGIIAADTYGIPNCRLVLSDNVSGADFKFIDYHLGINCNHFNTLDANFDAINVENISKNVTMKKICEDRIEKLLSVFPYDEF